jgi:imidazolonepropionase-like amidohydrolase
MPMSGVHAIDGAGATLMPGMVEAHTHFSWNDHAG